MLKNRRRNLVLFAAFACLMLALGDAACARKWGKVSAEEWNMTPPPEFPEADAVIIFNNGEVKITRKGIDFKKHERIKIFNKEGADDAAIVEIHHFPKDKIAGLRAHTITPEGKKIKVKGSGIFRKTLGKLVITTFTFPAIEDGAILEYKYSNIHDRLGLLDPWYFQGKLFTLSSRLTVVLEHGFNYSCVRKNLPADCMKSTEEGLSETWFTWEVHNLLPMVNEPLRGFKWDYQASLYCQLLYFGSEKTHYKYIKSWGDLGKMINDDYDEFTFHKKKVRELAALLCEDLSTDDEKIERLYDYVRNEIETRNRRGTGSMYFEQPGMNKVLEMQYGNSAEKNALLGELLRAQGIQAYPLLIGTRAETRFDPAIHQLWQFNHLLCYIAGDEGSYALDGSERSVPHPYLPPDDLIEGGLLISGEESVPITLEHKRRKSGTEIQATINVRADGSADGSTHVRISGYKMAAYENLLGDPSSKEHIRELLLRNEELSFEVVQARADFDTAGDSMCLDFLFEFPHFCALADDNIFLSPCIFLPTSSPFVRNWRICPIDFGYPFKTKHEIRIIMPEGSKIAQVPEDLSQSVPGVSFSRLIFKRANSAEVTTMFSVSKPLIGPGRYAKLREVYAVMTAAGSDQMVITTGQ